VSPFLHTARLFLRPVDVADTATCQRWMNDGAVSRFLLVGRFPIGREAQEAFLRQDRGQDSVILAICERESGRHVGNCGLHAISWVDRHATFGIVIGETDVHGQGYGREATAALLDYAFDGLNLERVVLSTFSTNTKGQRCFRGLGFLDEGRLVRHRWRDGAWVDELLMAMPREVWRTRRAAERAGAAPAPGPGPDAPGGLGPTGG
jgi:ribosomal-protein-alanine N-acetyltransferase